MARYEDSRSYQELLVKIYNLFDTSAALNAFFIYSLINTPFSFSETGSYDYKKAAIVSRNVDSPIWITRMQTQSNAYFINFGKKYFRYHDKSYKGYGLSVRCVAKSPLLFLKKARSFSPTKSS